MNDLFFALLMACGIALVLFVNVRFLNNHFASGPFIHDTGWLSGAFFSGSLGLRNPTAVQNVSTSLYATHMFAAFGLGSSLWRRLPIQHYEFYPWLLAIIYSLGFAVPFLLLRLRQQFSWLHLSVSFFASLTFAFSGLTLSCMAYPHPEPVIPLLLLATCVAYLSGYPRAALILLVLACLCREDAGLHFVGLLAVLAAYQALFRHKLVEMRVLGLATCVSLAIAGTLLGIQHIWFTPANFNSLLTYNYFHNEMAAQVFSAEFWRTRLYEFFEWAPFITLPFAAILVTALVRRQIGHLIGLISTVPWLLLNLQSSNPNSQRITLYYGFPMLLALAWPAIFERFAREGSLAARARYTPALCLLAISLASTWGYLHRYKGSVRRLYAAVRSPAAVDKKVVSEFREWLRRQPWDQRLAVGGCLAGLLPDDVPPGSVVFEPLAAHVETVAYSTPCIDSKDLIPQLVRFPYHYQLGESGFRLAARAVIQDLPRSAYEVVLVEPPAGLRAARSSIPPSNQPPPGNPARP